MIAIEKVKKQSKLLYESANIICWFRITTSVIVAFLPKGYMLCAILFALAFISDALDGWCYRKFAAAQPYMHWFNRLPMTLDPLADFFLVGGGVIHNMDNKPVGLLIVLGIAIVMALWNWLGSRASDRMFIILMTTLTYFWFVMMVMAVAGVWYYNLGANWPIGFTITMTIFYTVWLRTRVAGRTIRRRG